MRPTNLEKSKREGILAIFYAFTGAAFSRNLYYNSLGLTFTVTEVPTYGISVDQTALDFGSQTEGYSASAAQSVTITNAGNQLITLTQPTSTTNFVVGELSTTTLAVGGTATLSVQPKTGLSAGTYADTLIINGSNNVSASVGLSFTVTGAATHAVTLNIRLDGAAIQG